MSFKNIYEIGNLQTDYIGLGVEEIDNYLRGGIPPLAITEITGEAATGKTQISLTLLKNTVENDVNATSMYLCSEGEAPTTRLKGLLKKDNEELLNKILIKKVNNIDELIDLLHSTQFYQIIKVNKCKLIILDSITNLIRGEFDKQDIGLRNDLIINIANRMKFIYSKLNCRFVVINQVSGSGYQMHPALGLIWGVCVNCRIVLAHYLQQINTESSRVRLMKVGFSPLHPSDDSYVLYTITENGIKFKK